MNQIVDKKEEEPIREVVVKTEREYFDKEWEDEKKVSSDNDDKQR